MRICRSFDSVFICRAILIGAAFLVPRSERQEWLSEWMSEFWYFSRSRGPDVDGSVRFSRSKARFCLGSLKDAIWLRRNPNLASAERLLLRSPIHCGVFLSVLAGVTLAVALTYGILESPCTERQFILPELGVIGIALLILPTTTNLALGEYAGSSHSLLQKARHRRWVFLGMKIAFIFPIVFCGIFDLGLVFAEGGIQPHAMLIGYVLAFRWALVDQRRRCPVCLQLLTNPVRIGQPSHTMLEWYGTELICSKGHGLLHVPDTPTSSYSTQQWLYLDPSWRELFN